MNLIRPILFTFDRIAQEARDARLELVAQLAVKHEQPILVIASRARLDHWKSVMPKGMFSYTQPDAYNLRRTPFPSNTAILADPNLTRQELAFLRSKALHERVAISQVN